MDLVADHLKPLRGRVAVPRSIPGLVTPRLLVMEFMDGIPMTKLAEKTRGLSEKRKKIGGLISRLARSSARACTA